MALYLRGETWWFEIKTPTRRVRKSTGFKREDKAKAAAVYRAALVGMQIETPEKIIKGMLESIYQTRRATTVAEMWHIYADWFAGKKKRVAEKTEQMRRSRFEAFAAFAAAHRVTLAERVTVSLARDYVAQMRVSNKTIRMRVADLSLIWDAVGEMVPGLHNPWKAARPADDGSSRRRDVFSSEQQAAVLDAARKVGADWYGVCLAAKWTGQRYGDVARLTWGRLEDAKRVPVLIDGVVDLAAGVIVLDPSKTRRHGTRVVLPIADELRSHLETLKREDGAFLFPGHASHYAQGTQMHPPFTRVLREAKIFGGYYDFHSWRHTLRSMLGDAGVGAETANRFGGWTGERMGAHYDHSAHLDEMREALAKIKTAP